VPITIVDHEARPVVEQAPGVRYRLRAGGSTNARQLTVADRWFEPGSGVALHAHPAGIEEAIWVAAGEAEFEVDGEAAVVGSGHTVIVRAGSTHRFTARGATPLQLLTRWSSIEPVMVGDGIAAGTLELPS
jgi:quercetin dioxygenase-like cupin family protein